MDYELIEGNERQLQRTRMSGDRIVNCNYYYPEGAPESYCADWYSNNPCSPLTANCIDGEHDACPGVCDCGGGLWECDVTKCCPDNLAYYHWECN